MKMPGQTEGDERDELVSLNDFGPTFLEAAGADSPTEFAGRSLLSEGSPDALFFQTNGNETYGIQRSVLTDKWRFVYNGFDYDELYDLENDPEELVNLAFDPKHLERLRSFRKDTLAELRRTDAGMVENLPGFSTPE